MDAVFDQGPPGPCPAPFNLAAHVLAHARSSPGRLALSILHAEGAENWTFGALESAVRGVATGLIQAGLQPGDLLLMRLGNSVDFPITYLAAIAMGAVPVPTSAALTTPEITEIARQTAPAMIVAAPGVALPENTACPILPAAALAQMVHLPPTPFRMGNPDDRAYVIFTSGTAGQPRGVVHAHRAVWARRMMWQGWYGLTRQDRLFHAGAFNWTFTLGTGLMDPWAAGATALVAGSTITPRDIPDLLDRHKATLFAAAPGILRQVLHHPMPALPALRHALSAGEKLPDVTRAAWEAATGTPVHEAFGMSECSTFISSSPDRPAPPGTLGYPQPGRRVAILRDGQIAKRGQAGVLAVARSDPGMMLGYLGAGAETRARFQGDWFLTGDMARMDPDGAVTYLGRDDDMMNAGGVRVSPIEVESAMGTHPGIVDCAAVELPVKPGVSVIAAFYTGPRPLPEAELAAHAAKMLARYKQPRLFIHKTALPRGANNKLARRLLRDGAAGP